MFWGVEPQPLPRPAVDFVLYLFYILLVVLHEGSPLGNVLAHQAVGVLVQAPFPGGIGVGEIELRLQPPGDAPVLGELAPVVGGNRVHPGLVGQQQVDDHIGQAFGLFPPGKFLHQQEARGPLHQRHDGPSAFLAHHRVYLPVPEPAAFAHRPGAFLYRHPVLEGHPASHRPLAVLEPVAQLLVQVPA